MPVTTKWDVVSGFWGYGVIFASLVCPCWLNRLCARARARARARGARNPRQKTEYFASLLHII